MNTPEEPDFDTVAKALDRLHHKAGEAKRATPGLYGKIQYSRLENKMANMRRDFLLLRFEIEDAERDSKTAVFCKTCGAQENA
jgi:hypothetical protein